MNAFGMTDIGLQRRENQDTYAIARCGQPERLVAVVCDGMGGANGGSVASGLAVDTFCTELSERLRSDMTAQALHEALGVSVAKANRVIYERAQTDLALRGMGTTLVAAVVEGERVSVCNVGDSRAYRISAGGITRITRDHSVVEEMIERGEITPAQARIHPSRNIITRALGPDEAVACDCFDLTLREGEKLLLCSDGLIVAREDDEILSVVQSSADPQDCVQTLIERTKQCGAPDNVTVVLVEAL